MKKIALMILLLLFCISTVGAYSFQFIGPPKDSGNIEGYIGDTIRIRGESQNIPPGIPMTLRVSGKSSFTRTSTIQADGTFTFAIDTIGLKEGTYRFEINSPTDYPLGSGRNWFIMNLIDRRLLLTFNSPVRQEYSGSLDISGTVQELGAEGISLTVYGPSGTYFGPEWISTDSNGRFYKTVDIDSVGSYSVRIADRKGLINTVQIEVFRETVVIPTTTVSPTSTKIISVSATASRESPAYFIMQTLSAPVTLSTSLGFDWVIEYIDESGKKFIVNDFGPEKAETITFEGNGGTVYIRAYPDEAGEGTVHLYGQNVVSLTVSTSASDRFGELQMPGATPAEESPILILLPVIALALVVVLMGKKP